MTNASRTVPWWHGAFIYQVYVRSWRDSDGDGYGDLPGVIDGLDYLEWLGADAVWLSPTMPSPDDDWGYDVSDYLGVHPGLGTLDDLDRLVREAGTRGMRVLLDLVPNHTSSAHAWFVDARGSRTSRHRDFYVWADPAPGGGPPNNWLDHTGEPAWTFDEPTRQYYLHNFLPSQPDLNWWNPSVHEAFEGILRFWLDRGIAGFRIDVAHGLYKDAELRDDPPADPADPRGRNGLLPAYSANRPEVHGVYRDWRRIAEAYSPPAVLLGETWVREVSELAAFYGDDDELQLAFNFPFVFADFRADAMRSVVARTFASLRPGACPVWTASNHDISRFATRWCGGDERRIRLALGVLATLPGAMVLYYGDEIGMPDVDVPPALQRDPMTMNGRAGGPCRDRSRTPMQWSGGPTGGFAPEGVPTWLPLGDAAAANVADERVDPSSVISWTRALLGVRRLYLSGSVASYEELPGGDDQWVYRAGPLVVRANFSEERVQVAGVGEVLLRSSAEPVGAGVATAANGGNLELAPWECVVAAESP